MAQEYKPGEIVPQSGVYTITHDPIHADMPQEVTVIKGRRFPTCLALQRHHVPACPCSQARLGGGASAGIPGMGASISRRLPARLHHSKGRSRLGV
jgi:hypothetical protein